jgi:hypothetical protein
LTADIDLVHNPGTLKRKTPPGANSKRQTQIRMDDALKSRIVAYQAKMHKKTGMEVSFASAVRSLVEQGLKSAK